MRWLDLILNASTALRANRFRSVLAATGISIGVAGVVCVVVLMLSLSGNVSRSFEKLGSQYIKVFPFRPDGSLVQPELSIKDASVLKQANKSIHKISAVASSEVRLVTDRYDEITPIKGVMHDYFLIKNLALHMGRPFHKIEELRSSKVAVVGGKLYGALHNCYNLALCRVKINGHAFRVVGVFESVGNHPLDKQFDDTIFIPFSTFENFVPLRSSLELEMLVIPSANVNLTKQQIAEKLNQMRRIDRPENGFLLLVQQQLLDSTKAIMNNIILVSALVSMIALLVGGIGIMNIMLVSVTERRQEIAIRMANGALKSDIQNQFLLEAIGICLVGGMIGGAIGILFSLFISAFLPELGQIDLNYWVPLAVLSISSVIGVIFGTYPAKKAAELEPCESMRS
ncbi:ABC transporter permease [Alteromonas sp. BMJM2]|uniref:ABC transporter permease n=1 Tax=Alteromonas sp. BMJM2 TaxID=2954241 RepID=UPI0022B4755A|nr:ABC transporter permease [Alteromonas sp. BMJM2]